MSWSEALLRRLFSLVDYTKLEAGELEWGKTQGGLGHVASVCVLPEMVRLSVTQLAGSPIKVGTVANFPAGDGSLEDTLLEISRALQDGAEEIDVVFPYRRYLAGERQYIGAIASFLS